MTETFISSLSIISFVDCASSVEDPKKKITRHSNLPEFSPTLAFKRVIAVYFTLSYMIYFELSLCGI